MTRIQPRLAWLALLALALAPPAWAEGSASSAASTGSSASVGSLSTSIEKSSNSSSKGDKVAEGDYRVIEVAAAPARPGTLRLKLQAVADAGPEGELLLYVPQENAGLARLAIGALVNARERAYGLEFARGEPRQAFFLVLRDDWHQELQTRAVTL